jgi:hypothetical protein
VGVDDAAWAKPVGAGRARVSRTDVRVYVARYTKV